MKVNLDDDDDPHRSSCVYVFWSSLFIYLENIFVIATRDAANMRE